MYEFFGIATLVLLVVFLVVRHLTHTNMVAGFLFDLFLLFLSVTLLMEILSWEDEGLAFLILIIPAVIVVLILAFGVYFLVAFLILNTVVIFRREKPTLAHSLTLILALLLIALMVISLLITTNAESSWLIAVWLGIVSVIAFFVFHGLVFLTTTILSNLFKPRKNQDYLIVLGSGLVNGGVSPLLAHRIDRAITFATKQAKRRKKQPYLVMSGGQGKDEPLPEAQAMRSYAIQRGYPADLILTEDGSTSTLENMRFSHEVIKAHFKAGAYRSAYVTSNYHVFRAGVYAKRVGVPMDGLGAKTKFYYLPNAIIREYIAYIVMNKKWMLVVLLLIFLATTALLLVLSYAAGISRAA